MCVLVRGLYQQKEWSYSLRGSYVPVPASGEAGIQGPDTGQTECLSPDAGRIDIVYTCLYFPLMDLQPDQPERGTG